MVKTQKVVKPCRDGLERIDGKGHCKKKVNENSMKNKKSKTKKVKSVKQSYSSPASGADFWESEDYGISEAGMSEDERKGFVADSDEGMNEEQRRDFDEWLKGEREGKLKGKNLSHGIKPQTQNPKINPQSPTNLSVNCLKMFDDIALEKELEKRKNERAEKDAEEKRNQVPAPVINILVPRKKVPKA